MGVDWHGWAMKLPQNYPTKAARKLGHIRACVSVLRQGSSTRAASRLSICSSPPKTNSKRNGDQSAPNHMISMC